MEASRHIFHCGRARGEGVGIAVLGGGVRRLAEFGGRLDTSLSDFEGSDDHTTKVLEVAAASGPLTGPASKATIYSLVVRSPAESLKAASRIVERNAHLHAPIRVLYVPTGFPQARTVTTDGDPFGLVVEMARAAGIVICAPAGNGGPLTSPGSLAGTITVGGCNVNVPKNPTDDAWAEGTSFDTSICKPNILAPWGAFPLSESAWGPGARIAGTSPASALTAGHIATWFGANPALTPDGVIEIISQSCNRPTGPNPMSSCGPPWYGSIDFGRALELAIAWSPAP